MLLGTEDPSLEYNRGKFIHFDDVSIIAKSKKALLVDIEGEEVWIPASEIHYKSPIQWDDAKPDDEGTIIFARWIAETEGII